MDNIVESILKYLSGSQWDEVLFHYWRSAEFLEVIEHLKKMKDEGKRFVPSIKEAFRWMKLTPYSDIKVVIMARDRCCNLSRQGIPMSQDMSRIRKSEFNYEKRGIVKCQRVDVRLLTHPLLPPLMWPRSSKKYTEKYFNYDFSRWCKQGVLMVPFALTAEFRKHSQDELWKNFRYRIVDAVNQRKEPNLPWLLIERKTWQYEELIESDNVIKLTLFPQLDNRNWHTDINEALFRTGHIPIIWTDEFTGHVYSESVQKRKKQTELYYKSFRLRKVGG